MSKKSLTCYHRPKSWRSWQEEASELAQAALKLRRALDGTNPTPNSVAECEGNLIEEWADVDLSLRCALECDYFYEYRTKVEQIELKKLDRWLSRLEAKEQSDE